MEKEVKNEVRKALNYMHNTGLHPVIAAHMLVGNIASLMRYDHEASDALYRIGYRLCVQERNITMGLPY